jgi:sporulation protein YlmC with PRC-barrel domain
VLGIDNLWRNFSRLTLVLFVLAALACRAVAPGTEPVETASPAPAQTQPPARIPGTEEGRTPEAGAADSTVSPPLAPTETSVLPAGKPPQSQRAEIRPEELRAELTRASVLVGFQVLDREGALLGTVADLVINTCETYLIYFLVTPADGPGSPTGTRPVIPYEVVTINSGVLDARARTIQLAVGASQVAGAPAFPETQELVPVDWEASVRDYWSQAVRLSNLTSGCRVPAPGGGTTEIHKVAYASELAGAELRDGLQNGLGRVEEIIFEPESGKVSFFVTRVQAGPGLALVPLRVVNIPKEALGPGTEISLVLLVENDLLLKAPQIESIEEAVQVGVQGAARAYWGQ